MQLCLGLPSDLFPSGYSNYNYNSNYISRRLKFIELLIMQFSLTSLPAISLRSKYSPQNSVPNTLSPLHASLNVSDQISHQYIITGNIIFLYIF
jgi:hypothetical protein